MRKSAAKDLTVNPSRFNRGRIAGSYLNKEERKYIHLLDGGVSDNIGLRGPLVALTSNDPGWNLPNQINSGKVEKLVVIVVDARTDPKTKIDQTPSSPGLLTIVDVIASVPMSNYSFDTVQLLLQEFEQWRKDRQGHAACEKILKGACPAAKMPTQPPPPIDAYAIYVGFDQVEDKARQKYLLNLPTTFYLSKEDVDELRKVGPQILDESKEFQRLCSSLKCREQ